MRPTSRTWVRYGIATALAALAVVAGVRFATDRCKASEANMPQHKYTNHLIDSTSPYLLQHAHNPVDWYPWGPEALAKAKREDKPIFLSIGYSACHWCHVMERESFENEAIARIMNKYFVCIKVDREERPDLDAIYMTAVQLMTGSGGWPMSVWLTPDLKPFYAGTYFPPESRWGRPGFKQVLEAVADAYKNRRQDLLKNTEHIVAAMKQAAVAGGSGTQLPSLDLIKRAVALLDQRFDSRWGGWGRAPKFPSAVTIELLLRYHHRTSDARALEMATVTLDKMAYGGLYDQLAGGFHRYSVDEQWLVPHFEKMLYDNAQLACAYLAAYQATSKPLYRRVAKETLDYVLRDMTDESGGFHSTEDADSEGEEGKFYVWDDGEIRSLLGGEDAKLFMDFYGVTARGNFEGHNILNVPVPPEEFSAKHGLGAADLEKRLKPMRERLLAARAKRVRPSKDDKVLADWNGLMISAFARGSQVLGDAAYRRAAERAADFVLTTMRGEAGQLLHAHRRGKSHIDAHLDDYAFMAIGLIDLYEATFDVKWLDAAKRLVDQMDARFWDDAAGGFFFTEADRPNVIVRAKSAQDQATPSGNAAAARALLRLAKLTGDEDYTQKAERTLATFRGSIERDPSAFSCLLGALDFYTGPTFEVAIIGHAKAEDTRAMLGAIRRRFLPNTVVALLDPSWANADAVAKSIPLLATRPMVGGKATVYVCQDFQCKAPVTDAGKLEGLLK